MRSLAETRVPEGSVTSRPRLPQPAEPPSRGPDVARGVLSALVLLAVVVGVPVLLVRFVGWPLPTTLPDRSWLTAPIGAATLVKVFAGAVWLAWLHFTVCVAVEVRAELRSDGRLTHVPLGGGSQPLARRLVVAVLLLLSSGLLAPAAGAVDGTPAARTSTAAEPSPGQTLNWAGAQVSGDPSSGPAAGTALATGGQTQQAPAAATATRGAGEVTKLYEVKPPHGRHYECLWDIAETYLGSGFRYKELVALNTGRMQPDGRTLKNPDLIYPGWVLLLPADATGSGLRVVERTLADGGQPAATSPAATSPAATSPAATSPAATSPAATPNRAVPGGSQGEAARSGATGAEAGQAGAGAIQGSGADQGSSAASTDASNLAGWAPYGVAGATLAAGVLVALLRRRGAFGRPDEDAEPEVDLRLAADLPLALWVDRALRDLSQRLDVEGHDLPPVYAAQLDAGVLSLALSPAVPDAPAPWRASAGGRTWTLPGDADIAPADQLAHISAPYPGLVTLGRHADQHVQLVDLEAASGVLSLGGDTTVAREVAASIAVELATNLWSDDVRVTLVGFGDDLTALNPSRLRHANDLDAVLADVEADTARQAAACAAHGLSGVLRGRQVRPDRLLWRPQYLVLSAAPTSDQAAQLAALSTDPARGVGVVVVGDVPTARWRFVVTPDGALHAAALGLELQAQRLSVAQYAPAVRMLTSAAAAEASPRAGDDVLGFVRGEQPEAGLADDAMADLRRRFAVEVRLLGPIEVVAPGHIEPSRREQAVEIVVAAALHPRGLHPHVLAAAVWPRGASASVQEATLRQVQQWLGADTAGRPRLARGDDGLWRLGPDVRVDWRVCDALVQRAAGADEATDLATALALVRGPAFSGLPAGRYAWLARGNVESSIRLAVVSAAERLSVLATGSADRELAREALRTGLRMVPTAQSLWRALVRLEHDHGGAHAAGAVAREAYAVLAAHDVPGGASPETDALVDHLAPGVRLQVA